MVRANLHNLLMVGAMAILVILLLRKLAGTKLSSVPVLGQVVNLGAAA